MIDALIVQPDENAACDNGLSVKRDRRRIRNMNGERYLEDLEEPAHATDRPARRSRPSHISFRRYRNHHMGHDARRILFSRLASAI